MRHFYGPDPSQFADPHLPAGPRRPGTVVLIHVITALEDLTSPA
jgi:hypothetical protein